MSKKLISLFLVGATLAYAGVLSLVDSLYVGLGMVFFGALLSVLPAWTVLRQYWPPSGITGSGFAGRTGKRRKKMHLHVVQGNREDPPTYH